MEKYMIPFAPTQEGDRELIDKKRADERKGWLRLRQFKVTLPFTLNIHPFSLTGSYTKQAIY